MKQADNIKKYFRKFGLGWLITGIAFVAIYAVINPFAVGPESLIIIFAPFVFGFLGFTRFFAWIVSWEILVILSDVAYNTFWAGAKGGESLGSPLLLTLPLFLLAGIADEIRCRIKLRRVYK